MDGEQNIQLSLPTSDNRYFKAVKPQPFPFQLPFVRYLLKNANGPVLRRLHSICKLLIIFRKIILCKRLEISSDISHSYTSTENMCIQSQDYELKGFHNILVYGTLKCVEKNDSKFLSTMISKHLYRCEAKCIYLYSQELSISDFKFLLSKKAKTVVMKYCTIMDYELKIRLDEQQITQLINNFPSLKFFKFLSIGAKEEACETCCMLTRYSAWWLIKRCTWKS